MIKSICIKNFKSIRKERIDLRNLTLLFGMNGMGKSSTIQSLLLCRQSFWHNGKNDMGTLFSNGELIELGTIGDIYCFSSRSASNSGFRGLFFFQGAGIKTIIVFNN